MTYPILDKLRKLEINDHSDLESFLKDLEDFIVETTGLYLLKTVDDKGVIYPPEYLKFTESELKTYYSLSDIEQQTFLFKKENTSQRITAAIMMSIFEKNADIQLSDTRKILAMLEIRNTHEESDFLLSTLYGLFTEHLSLQVKFSEVRELQAELGIAQFTQEDELPYYTYGTPDKNPDNLEVIKKELVERQYIAECQRAFGINPSKLEQNLNDLVIDTDVQIANQLRKNQGQRSGSVNEETPPDYRTLKNLSRLADQLVADAARRVKNHPEERLMAARIRLSINHQRSQQPPVTKELFLEKLEQHLKNAGPMFNRHRDPRGLRIIKNILTAIGILCTSMISPSTAIANSYVTSGQQVRLFNKAPTVNLLKKALETETEQGKVGSPPLLFQ